MITGLFKKPLYWMILVVLVVSIAILDNNAARVSAAEKTWTYDLLITGGRVIDPETGRDEVAAIAIKNGVIKKISAVGDMNPGDAAEVIDAKGMVVAPGFINTHTHEAIQIDTKENLSPTTMLMVRDGITFWLGGNCGLSPTGMHIVSEEGVDIKQGDHTRPLRQFFDEAEQVPLYNNYGTLSGNLTLRSQMGLRHMENETPEQIEKMKVILADDLAAGSFGISSGLMYDMGATTESMLAFAEVSEKAGGIMASHTRYPTFNLKHLTGAETIILKRSIYEAIEITRQTHVPFIVSHITAMAQADSARWNFKTIDKAIREEELPMAGDIIGDPYISNDMYLLTFKGKIPVSTMLRLGNYDLKDVYNAHDVYVDGKLYKKEYEQFTLDEIEYLRKNVTHIDGFGQTQATLRVICKFIDKHDAAMGLRMPWVFIGNDFGGPARDPKTGEWTPSSHRALSIFTRLLGYWVREEKAITMKEALFKATIAPALWLGLDKKGRLQEGCDADIVIFNPDTVAHKADWLYHKEMEMPVGMHYVIVNGQIVVHDNELTGLTPGRLIRRTWKIKGDTQALIALYDQRFGKK